MVNSAAGRTIRVNDDTIGYYLNQNAVYLKTKNSKILNQVYLAYLGQTEEFKNYIQVRGKGAASQMRIAIGDIKSFPVKLIPIEAQEKIASILLSYDDLIENNLKRIKLLEEMAQITYEEWFVRMKFPGHETAVFDEKTGLPEGWKIETLGKLLSFQKGRKVEDISDTEFEGSQKILLLKSLETGDYEYTLPHGHVCTERNDVLMLMDGARSSHCFRAEKGIVGSTMAKLAMNEKVKPFIYYFLTVYREWLVTANTGAAIPHANKSFINKIQIKMPSEKILENWNDLVVPLEKLIWTLKDQTAYLKEARDILLPRLMTGMIDIEQAELPDDMFKRLESQ